MKRFRKLLTAGMLLVGLVSCSKERRVMVSSFNGNEDMRGAVKFETKESHYFDEGFDGTLDKVIYWVDGERTIITKGSPGFEEHIPGYLEARAKVTKGY